MANNGRRRVVVTGMGAVTPLGNDVETSWRAAVEGRSGIGPITRFDASAYDTRIAGEVRNFNPEEYAAAKDLRRMDPFIHYAIAASKQAAAQANLVINEDNAEQVAVLIGSGIGGLDTLYEAATTLLQKGPSKVGPFTIPMLLVDLAAGQVSIQMGAKGPNFAVVSACASSAHSIGEGAELIRRGAARVVFTGGAEACVGPLAVASFGAMRALSTRNDEPEKASRPFDKLRDGFVLGEGAGTVLLEDLDYALERGAPIFAEVTGYGATADASHITAPAESGDGAARAMLMAIKDAGLTPRDIGYINAHGTSTPLNEKYETMAIKRAFGDAAYGVPVSSTKSVTGHLLGAAGAIEAIFCIKAITEGLLPPTINQEVRDPDCDLDYVPNEARPARINHAMCNSMGFGGHNGVVIFSRYEG
ncbi:MAG TPA: beta-ketoacyl-ACP synthase II [Chloroflexia bacterium]|nr:beta-ketoacyl-ACP synthase II [Chloroflexia bacterium]